jgi:hypothetical protein
LGGVFSLTPKPTPEVKVHMLELAAWRSVAAAKELRMTNHTRTIIPAPRIIPVELKPNRARAGRKDVPILYVLLWSTALAVLVLAGIFFGFHAMVH